MSKAEGAVFKITPSALLNKFIAFLKLSIHFVLSLNRFDNIYLCAV